MPRLTDYEMWKETIVKEVAQQLDCVDEFVVRGLPPEDAQAQVLTGIAVWLSSAARNAEARNEVDEAQKIFDDMSLLTQRQREIMALVSLQIKPKRIAELLTLSLATVQGHIRDARKRIRESTRDY